MVVVDRNKYLTPDNESAGIVMLAIEMSALPAPFHAAKTPRDAVDVNPGALEVCCV
jgi:hypothetical protein